MIELKEVIERDIKIFEAKALDYKQEIESNKQPEHTDYFKGKADAYEYAAEKLRKALSWYFA
ncbi:hypothetical protein [Chondrinema litorale]|uniref:hypothetical protein n=1 Tax=Chondrinema litorale TaxID=2994555 RepID=UPI0025429976|nr:hypothetical protein [Chondrinema litorale]UZR97507.1 hypothetical protein OQ292_27250 [Chondrinema litorale]